MKKINITPLKDRVVIERLKEKKTSNGIIIPETVSGEKPQKGKVVAVGPGKSHEGKVLQLDVKVGDDVIFGKYSGTEIKIDGHEYLVMREEDIIGIINS